MKICILNQIILNQILKQIVNKISVAKEKNKNQKLFKDAKTIAARFNKNSLLKNYNTEINYYENLRTPWWSEN